MLSLILVSESVYNQLKLRMISTQPPNRQPQLAACLERLMSDVQRTLEPKNRDKFTQVRPHMPSCLRQFVAYF